MTGSKHELEEKGNKTSHRNPRTKSINTGRVGLKATAMENVV